MLSFTQLVLMVLAAADFGQQAPNNPGATHQAGMFITAVHPVNDSAVLDRPVTLNELAVRAVEPMRGLNDALVHEQLKDVVPTIALVPTETCPNRLYFTDEFSLPIFPGFEKIRIERCFGRPVQFLNLPTYGVQLCPAGEIRRTVRLNPDDVVNPNVDIDRIEDLTIVRCMEKPRDCWGQWVTNPWDYEWIVQIPQHVEDQYDAGKPCGEVFKNSMASKCGEKGFHMTRFTCEPRWYGVELRFRTDLLCGKTRIEDAMKAATNNELVMSCPYFVEVPVP